MNVAKKSLAENSKFQLSILTFSGVPVQYGYLAIDHIFFCIIIIILLSFNVILAGFFRTELVITLIISYLILIAKSKCVQINDTPASLFKVYNM